MMWNNHEVACLISELFGDDCACNFNGIDEWLPMKCDFGETACPNPGGVTCWEQFLIHRERKPLTNADRIRSMTDEELADVCVEECGCPISKREDGLCLAAETEVSDETCRACWLDWLKQEVGDGT